MNLQPLRDIVVIKPDAVAETTAGGIILQDSVKKDAPDRGTIVAMGPEVSPDLEIGMHVLYEKYDLDLIKIDGVEYSIGTDEHVVATLK